jgi:hypothetical protein
MYTYIYTHSNEMLSIVALLSVPRIFMRPAKEQKEADEAHDQFAHKDGACVCVCVCVCACVCVCVCINVVVFIYLCSLLLTHKYIY